MDDGGRIAVFETERDARDAGYTLPLTDQEAAELKPLSRKERRRRAAEMRVNGAAAKNPKKYKQRKKKSR